MDATPQVNGVLLLADAQAPSRAALQACLARTGWQIVIAETGRQALDFLSTRSVDLAILDLRLPDVHGVSLIEQVLATRPGLPILAIAAEPTVELAVDALRSGAIDFLAKPIQTRTLLARLAPQAGLHLPAGTQLAQLGHCVSAEPAVGAILREAGRLAASECPIAICGAPGTGRKHLATAMHQASGRTGPLHVLDMTVVPAEQVRARLGQAVEAAGPRGTVLLADLQQLKANEQDPINRALAASGMPRFLVTLSEPPSRLLEAARIHKGLANRLAQAVLSLPPLAARKADLELLASQMVAQVVPNDPPALSPAALQALARYDWPGNIRQLRLVVERAARLAGAGHIEPRHLPILQAVHRDPVPLGWTSSTPVNLQEVVDNIEREMIETALGQTGQNQAKAAELLGIPRTTLRDKLDKYGFTARARANAAAMDGN